MLTRRQAKLQENQLQNGLGGKRKALDSPMMDKISRKRSAFGDITNALRNVQISSTKKSIDSQISDSKSNQNDQNLENFDAQFGLKIGLKGKIGGIGPKISTNKHTKKPAKFTKLSKNNGENANLPKITDNFPIVKRGGPNSRSLDPKFLKSTNENQTSGSSDPDFSSEGCFNKLLLQVSKDERQASSLPNSQKLANFSDNNSENDVIFDCSGTIYASFEPLTTSSNLNTKSSIVSSNYDVISGSGQTGLAENDENFDENFFKFSPLKSPQTESESDFKSESDSKSEFDENESEFDYVKFKFRAKTDELDLSTSFEDPIPDYDYDKENELDPFHVPEYAQDIFRYYKKREASFKIGDYITKQTSISKHMRSILVDWMVEIQESFELNHETLYQAVKMTDLYLDRETVDKKFLQLVGTTALFISSKFDERSPPACEDFLYICDDAYTRKQMLDLEREMLKCLDFDIGFPLSYRFLRRYAKASKICMETLTLARYILETSLMHYEYIPVSESLIAAACLLLAIRMKHEGDWTPILQKYSGCTVEQIEPLVWKLNRTMKNPPSSGRNLVNIKKKYSHEVFYQVSSIPFLDDPINQQLDQSLHSP